MKKNEKKRRNSLIMVAVGIMILVIVASLGIMSIEGKNSQDNPASDVCFTRECDPEYWSEIPEMPRDFETRKNQYQYNTIPDSPSVFTDAYWKQPEWVTRTGEEVNNFYKILDGMMEGRETIWCVGIYDAEKVLRLDGDELKMEEPRINPEMEALMQLGLLSIDSNGLHISGRFWIRACPGARRHFGVKLSTYYPDSEALKEISGIVEGGVISSPAHTAMQYITLIPEMGHLTLGTYYPKLEYDYNREVNYELTIDKDIPKGWYIVGINAGVPDRSYQVNQSIEYGFAYTDPNIGMSAPERQFKIFIEVM